MNETVRAPIFQAPDPEKGYRPQIEVDDDTRERIKDEIRAGRAQVTPRAVQHGIEAEEIRRFLRSQGIRSIKTVIPDQRMRGTVRLTFEQFRMLCNQLDEGFDGFAPDNGGYGEGLDDGTD